MNYTINQLDEQDSYAIKMFDTYHMFAYTLKSELPLVVDPSTTKIKVSLTGLDDVSPIEAIQTDAYGGFKFSLDNYYYHRITPGSHKLYVWVVDDKGNKTIVQNKLGIDISIGCYINREDELLNWE